MSAVLQDDPLAYGLDRLRDARAVLAARQGEDAERDLSAVDDALARERVDRIQTIAGGFPAPEHLTARLGALPMRSAPRDTWCGLALQLETRLDLGQLGPATSGTSIADRLIGSTDPLDHARSLIAAAHTVHDASGIDDLDGPHRWLQAVDRAGAAHRVIEQQRSRELDHDLGISL
ncbi:MAG: hypothetical protein ACRD0G_18235 [Acidimicrobiales bacterium]